MNDAECAAGNKIVGTLPKVIRSVANQPLAFSANGIKRNDGAERHEQKELGGRVFLLI
jgi:hypothetical protein